ncbi:acyltransferase [Clostridiales bacterium COT073_COT-073]|nr:acyltransferase [Clostridiales bacterium COT073_COT-073]
MKTEIVDKSKQRLAELDTCRALAALSVLAIHVTSIPLGIIDKNSLLFQLLFIINRFLQYAVPLFLMMSAILEGYHFKKVEGFYLKKARRVLLPYLVWSLLYMGFNQFLNRGYLTEISNWKSMTNIILFGDAHYHLYFMSILLQFLFLFPWLWKLQKRFGTHLLFGLLGSFALQMLLCYLVTEPFYPVFPNIVKTFPRYFFILNGGLLIGLAYAKKKELWHKYKYGIIAIALLAMGYYIWLEYQLQYHAGVDVRFYLPVWYLYSFFISLCFLAFSAFLSQMKGPFKKGLDVVSKNSYGIYLLHPMILEIHRKIWVKLPVPSSILYLLIMLIVGVSVLVISILTAAWISKNKYTAWMLGEMPRAKN